MKSLLVTAAAFLLAGPAAASPACDNSLGWYGNEEVGACYLFDPLTNNKADTLMDWYAADAYCRDKGGHLATIRTAAQQNFIRMFLGTMAAHNIWTAGNDEVSEGVWEWGFDTGDLIVYENWVEGQPSGGDAENCLALYFGDGWTTAPFQYYWHDYACSSSGMEVLCEMSL